MAPDPTGRRSAVESAVLDYHLTPGKYPLIRRQPSVLYSSMKEVLQLASGRSSDGGAGTRGQDVREAACFFVRSALLYPGADHYALFGLEPDADPAAVKDRYRLLMRLIHPDFSGAAFSTAWPTDAATRVNRAYEVLSSPVQRAAYDERNNSPTSTRAAPEARGAASRAPLLQAGAKPVVEDPRRRLKRLATAFGVAGALAGLGAWLGSGQADRETLVQRPPGPTAREAATVKPESVAVVALPESVASAPAAASLPKPGPAPPVVVAAAAAPSQTPLQIAPLAPPPVAMPAVAPAIAVAPAPITVAAPSPQPVPAPAPPVAAARLELPLAALAAPIAQAAPVSAVQFVQAATTGTVFRAAPSAGPTMVDVHPLLAKLLQELESGWGDRVLNLLDRDARGAPSAQALVAHYNGIVDGARPVRLASVQFKAEPRDSRLLVTGRVRLQVRDPSVPARELAMVAEFISRDGNVVMTRLARAPEQP